MLVEGKAEYSPLQKTRSKKVMEETFLLESDLDEDETDVFLASSKYCTY